ncbi:endolytic transglycosylase MltG [Rhodospirillales bacterium]|nr:endolytic transglycosylase MltG [Rhodospirillales bacterium]
MRRAFFISIAISMVISLLAIGSGFLWLKNAYHADSGPSKDTIVLIEKGMGVAAIAEHLKQEGIVESVNVFRFGGQLFGTKQPLRAGEYRIPSKANPARVAEVLKTAEQVVYKTTIAEGLTTLEIVDFLRAQPGLQGDIVTIPVEGALLPETYHFHRGETRLSIIKRMSDAMQRTVDELWVSRAPSLPLATPYEAVILASIVEKETGVAAERGKVAGVFINRLNKKMRLQSDPTVVYGITNGTGPLGRALTRKDLDGVTAYNTYEINRLPPTPIANPGRKAIESVLNPEQTDAIYFVADGTGGHAFSKTLKEHNRNVRAWRKFNKKN